MCIYEQKIIFKDKFSIQDWLTFLAVMIIVLTSFRAGVRDEVVRGRVVVQVHVVEVVLASEAADSRRGRSLDDGAGLGIVVGDQKIWGWK